MSAAHLPEPFARLGRLSLVLGLAAVGLSACASVGPPASVGGSGYAGGGGVHGADKPYQVDGRWYYPHAQPGYDQVGSASWYGQQFHNHRTADGEIFDQYGLSAAHKTLPLPCIVEVTNLDNGRSLRLRVNDRGPFVGDRILDVSRAAAQALGFRGQGLAHVRVRYIGPAPPLAEVRYARADTPAPRERPQAMAQVDPARAPPLSAQDDDEVSEDPSPPLATAPIAPPPSALLSAAGSGFAVQAAAFANRDNAQRAAARLGRVGAASIRPVSDSQGGTLYRVVLDGYADAGAAEAARLRVAGAGFRDARVIAAQ